MSSSLAGSLLALTSAVAYSAMYFLVLAGVRKTDLDGGAFVTTVVNASLLVGGTVIVSLAGFPPQWHLGAVAWFAVSGVLGTFGGRVLGLAGLRRIGPVRTASIGNTAPVVTIAISVLFLGERLSGAGMVAAAMVLFGLGLLAADAFSISDPVLSRAAPRGPVPGGGGIAPAAAGRASRLATPAVAGLGLSVGSAVAFGSARVARRVGIGLMPDALVGAMVGAVSALASQLIMQAGQGRMRSVVLDAFRDVRPAIWLAGVASTIGLLAFFAAIRLAPLSQVAVIAASETVITMALSWVLFRRREALSPQVVIAAVSVFGAGVVVALG